MKMLDLITVGHFAIDHIQIPRGKSLKQTLGGSTTYVSLAARKLGARVGVISNVGDDFPETYVRLLHDNGVDLSCVRKVKNTATTSFILKYEDGNRRLLLRNRALPILLEDVASVPKAKTIHVAPIADEISSEVVEELRKRTDTLSLDPQGFIRKFGVNGRVGLKKWKDKRVLEQVDVYKSSLQEITKVTGVKSLKASMREIQNFGTKIVVVTLGKQGALLLFDESFYEIPTIQPQELVDPTGAGDVFAGAFLAEHIKKKEPVWCACVGSAMASFKVETFGPLFSDDEKAVYIRAERLFDECMRVETHNGL
jgi:sugar/nucleoside kinase (ribokinase family)